MDYNTISDMIKGFVGGSVLLSIYVLKQAVFPKSLLILNDGLNYSERYFKSLKEQFPEEFQPRENKPGLVKRL